MEKYKGLVHELYSELKNEETHGSFLILVTERGKQSQGRKEKKRLSMWTRGQSHNLT